jgi:AraC-like DNA-binding protein
MSDHSEVLRDRPVDSRDPLPEALAMAAVNTVTTSGLAAGGRWALRFRGYQHAKVIAVAGGTCWVGIADAAPVHLDTGDCFLLDSGVPYVTASDPDVVPEDGARVFAGAPSGVARVDGTGAGDADTVLVAGAFDFDDTTSALLLDGFPAGVRIAADGPHAAGVHATLRLLAAEENGQPGENAVRWHLTQVLYLQVLRALLGMRPADTGAVRGWLAAVHDPQVGAALAALHRDPGHPWTLPELAAAAGTSRTVFATRFKELLGMSAMVYLSRWRIRCAERELADGTRTVAAVAGHWGYGSESAFSAAFKRVTGHSPGRSRTAARRG